MKKGLKRGDSWYAVRLLEAHATALLDPRILGGPVLVRRGVVGHGWKALDKLDAMRARLLAAGAPDPLDLARKVRKATP